jgi:hypothetical protein
MKGHMQGFLTFLDLLAEGSRRQADLIAGGGFGPQLQLQVVPATARKNIPLTQDQITRLFDTDGRSRVSIED